MIYSFRRKVMKYHCPLVVTACLALFLFETSAAVLYVDANGTNPTPPYGSWNSAATNVQDAIDTSAAGDQILVTNGVYQTGGRVLSGNRVVVDKAVIVQSVNGPAVTFIDGMNGVRCVYLASNAVLAGFTLTNGSVGYKYGGGVYCESTNTFVSNCVIENNSAQYGGGGVCGGTLDHCQLSGNSGGSPYVPGIGGGAAYSSVLNDCTLSNNSAVWQGGGADSCTLNQCALTGNAGYFGGGAKSSTLNQCTLTGNSAYNGGGAESSTLLSCTVSNNSASGHEGGGANGGILNHCALKNNWGNYGGGAANAVLNNCLITGNSSYVGGGVYQSTLTNCTVAANSVNFNVSPFAGADSSTLNNCILYDNAGDNYDSSTLNYCCTTPLPDSGTGNFSDLPVFVDPASGDFHLQTNSPCINAGNNAYVSDDTDFDGNPRMVGDAVDIGAYESQGVISLSTVIQADATYTAVGNPLFFTGLIVGGFATSNIWDFGDGTRATNQLAVSHTWASAGDYPVVFTAFNDFHPDGVGATLTVRAIFHPIHYVSLTGTNPVAPYLTWNTAATNIQDAVDAALITGTVLVSNGVYAAGGRVVDGLLTNRVAVTKAIAVQSVNGPAVTVIQGYQVPATTNGDSAIRCVYLNNDAVLSGFTLTNGATRNAGDGTFDQCGGGVFGESPPVIESIGAAASTSAVVSNCVIAGNSVYNSGGGAFQVTLNNCMLMGNFGGHVGGGAANSTVNNCALTGNFAVQVGGGAYGSTLNNCTVIANSAQYGGGVDQGSVLNNCILFYNLAPTYPNYVPPGFSNPGTILNYCCTTPAAGGPGNITSAPQLIDSSHISAGSLCRGTGNPSYVSGVDIDGEEWSNPPSIGCDEYYAGPINGPLNVAIQADYPIVVAGHTVNFIGMINGHASVNICDFGDGTTATNQLVLSHAWAATGDYAVTLTAYNDENPGGVSATLIEHVVAPPVLFVDASGVNPVAPYLSWATAATNIQDAMNAVSAPGSRLLVTNGVYSPVVLSRAVKVQSINGPIVTVIDALNGAQCAYLDPDVTLTGFTITNGGNYGNGGGAQGGTLNNCILAGNGSYIAPWTGGGASSSTLNNCLLYNNVAFYGGGANSCTLNNCTIIGNSGVYGSGGTIGCTLNNCIEYYNQGSDDGSTVYHFSCTDQLPGNTANNFTDAPAFVDLAGGDFHLQSNSPCINFGNDVYVTNTVDLDGNPRIVGDAVDVGAYEFQTAIVFSVAIQADGTIALIGFPVDFIGTAVGGGPITTTHWDFGDGTTIDDQSTVSHTWTAAGDYPVVFTVYNGNHPDGISATVLVHIAMQFIQYVALESTNPVAPYLSWDTAATSIQDAVDAGIPGSTVLVSNGVYSLGGHVVYGSLTNRVAVTRQLTIQSVNGSAVTIIQGNPVVGDNAVRCVYLTNGAVLAGFTLTNGATRTDGDWTQERSGAGVWCESSDAIVSNCVVSGNTAAGTGGGAYSGTLNHCVLTANTALTSGSGFGGGDESGTLNNCLLTGNRADNGGGADSCTLNNCTLVANTAGTAGGGVENSTLNNCTLTGNAAVTGGGADSCTLNNCIVFYNTASGGKNNYSGSTLNFSCTTPLPDSGMNNITAEPQLTDTAHIGPASPCIGAGSTNYSSGVDVDRDPWLNPPSIGCDEYSAGASTGTLSVAIQAGFTDFGTGFMVNFTGIILGHAGVNVWDFGDGTTAVNQLTASHSWATAGDYSVVFTAFNSSNPGGVSASVIVHIAPQSIHYVAVESPNPVPPYLSWNTAAMNIQDAVDAAYAGDTILVSNGVYQTGGRSVDGTTMNRTAVIKPLMVQSINGAALTVIDGGSAGRCLYLTNDATLIGFTLTNGVVFGSGGGAFCQSARAVMSNCVLNANSALLDNGGGVFGGTLNNCVICNNTVPDYAPYASGGGAANTVLSNCLLYSNFAGESGGGALNSTLNNCRLFNNSANISGGGAGGGTLNNCLLYANSSGNHGGGADTCTLNSCTIVNNSTEFAGAGTFDSAVNNCIVYYNSCIGYFSDGDNFYGGTLNYCCTTPDPGGIRNITNNPALVDLAGSDFHLQTNSPCINSGNNALVTLTNDFDGNPRIQGGTVDIGACEFQTPTSVISYAWLQQYSLSTDGSADFADIDGDGFNNWQEWRTGTDPTDPLSLLKMTIVTNDLSGITVTWQSANGIAYFLQRSTDLARPSAFSIIQTNIIGQAGTTSCTDTTATNSGPYFYRVGVQ